MWYIWLKRTRKNMALNRLIYFVSIIEEGLDNRFKDIRSCIIQAVPRDEAVKYDYG